MFNRFLYSSLSITLVVVACKPKRPVLSDVHVTNGKEIAEHEYPAVVPLYKRYVGADTQTFSCTGTMVTPRIVLTAAHCVKGLADASGLLTGPLPDVLFDKVASRALRNPAYKTDDYNPENDLGLVEFSEDIRAQVMAISATEAKAGDSVVIIGFGRYNTNDADTSGTKRMGLNTIETIEDGVIRFHGVEKGSDFSGYDAASAKGDSGGPMLIGNEIVGVTSNGYVSKNRKFSNYVNLTSSEARAFFKHAKSLGFDIPLPDSYFK